MCILHCMYVCMHYMGRHDVAATATEARGKYHCQVDDRSVELPRRRKRSSPSLSNLFPLSPLLSLPSLSLLSPPNEKNLILLCPGGELWYRKFQHTRADNLTCKLGKVSAFASFSRACKIYFRVLILVNVLPVLLLATISFGFLSWYFMAIFCSVMYMLIWCVFELKIWGFRMLLRYITLCASFFFFYSFVSWVGRFFCKI